MTEHPDRRADATRLHILRAAARQFARLPYSRVSLDDILADAEVTKGAMYFHFRSKQALASAIIGYRGDVARADIEQLLAQKLSGLETLIDISYLVAAADIGDETARAGLNLLESIGRTDGLLVRISEEWVSAFAEIARRARSDGDLVADADPDAVARHLVSAYLGVRLTSDPDQPAQYLGGLMRMWRLALPGFAAAERVEYLTDFVRRRNAVAVRNAVPIPRHEL